MCRRGCALLPTWVGPGEEFWHPVLQSLASSFPLLAEGQQIAFQKAASQAYTVLEETSSKSFLMENWEDEGLGGCKGTLRGFVSGCKGKWNPFFQHASSSFF